MNHIKQYFDWLLLSVIIIMTLSLVAGIYLYTFHENPPAEISNLPLPVDKAVYHVGDTIFGTIDYCNYTNAPVTMYVSFVDDLLFTIPTHISAGAPPGCSKIYGKIVTIPLALPPGTYYLISKNEYKVNFLVTRYIEWYSVSFEVIK